MKNRETFALESTLSGRSYINYLKLAKERGYKIVLHFLWLPSVEESWKRVESRVSEGGHAVPEEAVRRRFPRIKELVIESYAPLADHWYLWDASQSPVKFIAEQGDKPVEYYL